MAWPWSGPLEQCTFHELTALGRASGDGDWELSRLQAALVHGAYHAMPPSPGPPAAAWAGLHHARGGLATCPDGARQPPHSEPITTRRCLATVLELGRILPAPGASCSSSGAPPPQRAPTPPARGTGDCGLPSGDPAECARPPPRQSERPRGRRQPVEFTPHFKKFAHAHAGKRAQRLRERAAAVPSEASPDAERQQPGGAEGAVTPSTQCCTDEGPDEAAVHTDDDLEEWPLDTTSIMLRNIPNRYTPEELLNEIDAQGFQAALDFDFFYIPTDFKTKRNMGYGFLNFCNSEKASHFRRAFCKRRLSAYATQKVLQMSPAREQGFEANARRYLRQQLGRVKNPWFKPMVLLQGEDARAALRVYEEESAGRTLGRSAQASPNQLARHRQENGDAWIFPLEERYLPAPVRRRLACLAGAPSEAATVRHRNPAAPDAGKSAPPAPQAEAAVPTAGQSPRAAKAEGLAAGGRASASAGARPPAPPPAGPPPGLPLPAAPPGLEDVVRVPPPPPPPARGEPAPLRGREVAP